MKRNQDKTGGSQDKSVSLQHSNSAVNIKSVQKEAETEENFDLHFLEYNKDNYKEINQDYTSGKKLINVSATGVMFSAGAKVVEEVNRDLYEIVTSG